MSQKNPHILLIEEDETLAELTAFRLELLGYDVTQMHTAEDALKSIFDSAPDVIVVDLFLPGMNGIEFINRLRSDESTSKLPVMVFSIDADLNTVTKSHAAGADDYLVTPYDPAVLQEKIERLLRMTTKV